MSTARSSKVLDVCLQIDLNKSTTKRLTAVVVKNLNSIGFMIFNIMLNMCYFPNITTNATFGTWLFAKQWSNAYGFPRIAFFYARTRRKTRGF